MTTATAPTAIFGMAIPMPDSSNGASRQYEDKLSISYPRSSPCRVGFTLLGDPARAASGNGLGRISVPSGRSRGQPVSAPYGHPRGLSSGEVGSSGQARTARDDEHGDRHDPGSGDERLRGSMVSAQRRDSEVVR